MRKEVRRPEYGERNEENEANERMVAALKHRARRMMSEIQGVSAWLLT
jgi:hypothetical protein